VGNLPHGGFASGDRSIFVLTSSGPGSTIGQQASSLWQRRLLEMTPRQVLPSHEGSSSPRQRKSYALFFMDFVCWLGLLQKISPPLLSKFQVCAFFITALYCIFSCYLPLTKSKSHYDRPVRLGVRRPSGTRDQFFFLL
jgi:hypothetical protein